MGGVSCGGMVVLNHKGAKSTKDVRTGFVFGLELLMSPKLGPNAT